MAAPTRNAAPGSNGHLNGPDRAKIRKDRAARRAEAERIAALDEQKGAPPAKPQRPAAQRLKK